MYDKINFKIIIITFIYKPWILISSLTNYVLQIPSSEDKSSLSTSGIISSLF